MRITVLLVLAFVLPLTALAAQPADDMADIQAVIEQFRTSIPEKDKDKFLATFLHDRVTWQAATSDERLAAEAGEDPQARKVDYSPDNTPEAFISGIIDSPAAIEETFSDVVIDTDGTVASVSFNFEFLRNGSAINAGREYWLLVKTEAGWKIAAATWSRNTP